MADKRQNSEQNSDSNDESDDDERLHEKRTKFTGAAIYKTKFNKDWAKKYPFLCAVETDPSSYRCNICSRILSCSHQGEADVKHHISSSNHMQLVKVQSKQPTITSMFAGESSDMKNKVLDYKLFFVSLLLTYLYYNYINVGAL